MRRTICFCLLVFASSTGTASAQVVLDNPWLDRAPLNIAHQGARTKVPSDTLYGFKTALPKGVDVLELDIYLTADGQMVALQRTNASLCAGPCPARCRTG